MLLPAERISTASITNIEANSLLIALDREGELLWVVSIGDGNFVLFLTGPHAGRGFKIGPDSVGSGMAIGPVQVRIDPTSVSTEWSPWGLKAVDDALAVHFQSEAPQGFPENVWARVAQTKTLPDTAVYFTRWSVGIECDDEWVELVNFTDAEVRSPIIGA
jgi:hypothetical protein